MEVGVKMKGMKFVKSISFDIESYVALKRMAEKERKPESKIIRELIKEKAKELGLVEA